MARYQFDEARFQSRPSSLGCSSLPTVAGLDRENLPILRRGRRLQLGFPYEQNLVQLAILHNQFFVAACSSYTVERLILGAYAWHGGPVGLVTFGLGF